MGFSIDVMDAAMDNTAMDLVNRQDTRGQGTPLANGTRHRQDGRLGAFLSRASVFEGALLKGWLKARAPSSGLSTRFWGRAPLPK